MDYEKKYKNALEKAKSMIDDLRKGEDILAVSDLEEMFPELNESELRGNEDESIRKELIEFLEYYRLNNVLDSKTISLLTDSVAWLEKQGQTFTKKDVDDAYLKGISDAKNELEKQGKQDARYRCLEELLAADDIYQMSVNDTMTNEAKEKAAKALSKLCIGKLLGFEKQGEQKPAWSEEDDYNLQCMIAKVTLDIQKGNVGRNNELIDWLELLKQRIGWGPSEEQMEVLLSEVNAWTKGCPKQKVLESLYNDLKKLK